MADNLIYPIGFDLESGVQDAIKRGDVALRQIQAAMNRKPIVLHAEVDASKFQMFSRQFTNSIDGISAKLAQAQRLWNAMTFDVKFDADGNLSRRAQVVFDAFQQLTQASATMGQRLGEVNRNLAKSEQDTARAITAEYDKRRQQINEQIRLKERQAAAEERVRQGQLKGVNVGYVETQRQVEAVRNLRLQYEAILPMLNAMAQRRYDIKVGIDKQFEADIQRINAEIARLRQFNLRLGAKGDTNAIQANLQAIRQLEAELQRISQQKIDLLNSNKINSDLARLRTEISSVFGELQSAERRLATDNSLNAALDAQSQKVLKLHADIQKLDQQFAQLNATGKAYNQDGSFTTQANTLLQQRITLTKQLEQEAITGQQAQIKLEQQLREEKRQTEQAAKNAAKEAERQAKAEAAARKQAQDAANAENKARQEAYNSRRRQGQETQRILNKEAKSIADITAKLQIQQQRLQSANIGSAKFNKIAEEVRRLTADLEKANQKMRELTGQTQSGAARQSAAVKQVSQEFKHQDGYVSRLLKRLAVYASFSYAAQFLTSIREVTAQFELQRVSLGAIIQDQQKANQLFSEIKSFALKSPVSILDLTKYTKQLAAYKIGVDELFETTKKLTDVSVGLGVSMDRVVLAYGQTRATGYLRACLGAGTRVKMYDGSYKNVEDVVVGDMLIGDDEKPRHISKLYQGEQQMYRVRYDGGEYRCNEHHILTVYDAFSERISDVFVPDYLKEPLRYQGVRRINGEYKAFLMKVEKDAVDTYYGFSIDGNHRFIIEDNIVTHNTEIRQFTEMGVPIVEELATKLSKMNGELVTAAQVMDMVSKRAISFDMVKEVFDDMTSAGGMFYQMQEKQGETLYGMWAKLGDAASVMYEQIGNTESVNNAMKSSIQLLTDLMRNWKQVGQAIGIGLGGLVVAKGVKTFKGWQSNIDKAKIAANEQYIAASNAYRSAIYAEQAARRTATSEEYRALAAKTASTQATYAAARAEYLAARNTTIWSKAWGKLKAAFLGNWVTLLLMGVAAIATSIYNAYEKANRLKKALAELKDESLVEADKSAFNFELLARKAVEAADGSKEQREALQELQNTYKNIIPLQELSIEKLKELRGNYEAYTKAIRENIAVLSQQKQMDLVVEEYGKTILEAERRLKKEAKGIKITLFETDTDGKTIERQAKLSNDQIDKYVAGVKYFASNTNKAQHEIRQMSLRLFVGLPENYKIAAEAFNYFDGANSSLISNIRKQDVELENIQNSMSMYTASMGIFGDRWKQVSDNIAKTPITGKAGSYLASRQKDLATINEYISALKDNFAAANIEWKESYATMVQSVSSETAELSTIDFAALKEAARKEGGDYAITLGNAIAEAEKGYTKLVPSDDIVNSLNRKLKSITLNTGASMDVMKKYLISGNDNIKDKLKSLTDSFDELTEKIYKFEQYNAKIAKGEIIGNVIPKEQIDALKEESKALGLFIELLQALFAPKETSGRGGKSDPRLQILNEMVQLAEKLNKEYSDWEKKVGSTTALEKVNATYAETVKYAEKVAKDAGISLPHLKTPTNAKELNEYLEAVRKVMETAKGLKGGKKAAIELAVKMSNNVSAEDQKAIEEKIKNLTDKISRTKTAKEFYDKVLGMTGDYDLAAKVSLSIYGDTGYDLQKQLAEQVRQYFQNDQVSIEIPVDVITADNRINYKRLGEFAEQMKEKLGEEPYKAIKKIAEDGQKDLAKTYEGYLKDLEKAKTYADKRIELARTTAEKIREINADIAAGNTDENVGKETIRGLQDAEDREAAKLEYEAFKDTPLYVQMFEDLEHASTSTLEMMKQRLTELSRVWDVALDPTQLKEIQSRMNEIDGQLRARNPFKALKESYQQYRAAVGSVSEKGALANVGAAEQTFYQRSEDYGADSAQARAAEKELKARRQILEISQQLVDKNGKQLKGQNALNRAAEIAFDRERDKRALLDMAAADEQAAIDRATAQGKDPNKDPDVIAKREALATAREEYEVANRTSEILQSDAKSSKTLKESMGEVAQQAVQFLQMGADIARGIADISEAMGADEEDVQYWNDVADALSEITAGVQDIVSAALKGDVMSVITGIITAIPKMFVGFVNLFSAGRIRDANKEIKKQEELLKDLEYTYGRLEKAADKLFGGDYIQNFNQRLRALQAQQKAYEKQAEAERSKGKKEDKEKTKEYLESARDTMDEIDDMQSELRDHFAGTDITSAARDFASAWIDAKTSFSDTTEAMRDKFKDMVQNMIIEAMAAKIMEHALQPFYNALDDAMADGDLSAEDIAKTTRIGLASITDMNNGMEVMWEQLKAAGVDVGKIWSDAESDFTGTAKNVSEATSEEINSVAAIGNTLMYYVSPIPRMDENLAAIRAIMERGATPLPATTAAGWTDWQQQAMDNYNAIARNTADTVTECRRAAEACEKMARAIKTKGATSGFNVFLNS